MYKLKEISIANFKRFIAIILIFTTLLIPFQKPKEANAIVGVDDAVLIAGGLALLTALGYTISSTDSKMTADIGRTAADFFGGFIDWTGDKLVGDDSVVVKVTDNIANKVSWDQLQDCFGQPKTVSEMKSLPYGARYLQKAEGYIYGTVSIGVIATVQLKLFNNGALAKTVESKCNPDMYTLSAEKAGSQVGDTRGRLMFKANDIHTYGGFNEYIPDCTYTTFEIDVVDNTTGESLDLSLQEDYTLPYDGTQVIPPATLVDVAPGTTITIPKGTTVADIPKELTKPSDIPGVKSDTEASTDVPITGWDWLDSILNKILNGIRAIPSVLKDFIKSIPGLIVDGIGALIDGIAKLIADVIEGVKAIPGAITSGIDSVIEGIKAIPGAIATGIESVISALFVPTLSFSDSIDKLKSKLGMPTVTFPDFSKKEPLTFNLDFSINVFGKDIEANAPVTLDQPWWSVCREILLGMEMFYIIVFAYKKISALHGGDGE